jgi:hypothetical protein
MRGLKIAGSSNLNIERKSWREAVWGKNPIHLKEGIVNTFCNRLPEEVKAAIQQQILKSIFVSIFLVLAFCLAVYLASIYLDGS